MKRSTPDACWRAVAALVLLLLLPGCTFLADEFSWFDRAAPAAPPAPLTERP